VQPQLAVRRLARGVITQRGQMARLGRAEAGAVACVQFALAVLDGEEQLQGLLWRDGDDVPSHLSTRRRAALRHAEEEPRHADRRRSKGEAERCILHRRGEGGGPRGERHDNQRDVSTRPVRPVARELSGAARREHILPRPPDEQRRRGVRRLDGYPLRLQRALVGELRHRDEAEVRAAHAAARGRETRACQLGRHLSRRGCRPDRFAQPQRRAERHLCGENTFLLRRGGQRQDERARAPPLAADDGVVRSHPSGGLHRDVPCARDVLHCHEAPRHLRRLGG